MSWAGLERVARIKGLGYLKNLNFDPVLGRDRALETIEAATRAGSIPNGPRTPLRRCIVSRLDIATPTSGVVPKTVEGIRTHLAWDEGSISPSFIVTSKRRFWPAALGFVICSFWVAQACRTEGDARKILEDAVSS